MQRKSFESVNQLLQQVTEKLVQAKQSDTPQLEAQILVQEVLSCSRVDLFCNSNLLIREDQLRKLNAYVRRRISGEPIAYIIGKQEFMGHSFNVNKNVLIPRPETEHIVENAKKFLLQQRKQESADKRELKVLDIGTGSGCILLSLASLFPEHSFIGIDISESALELSQQNQRKLGLSKYQIKWFKKDILINELTGCYDLIVSNPPYISIEEKHLMSDSVLAYEPHGALFAEKNGLQFYQAIADKCRKVLEKSGKIIVEIGFQQEQEVKAIFESYGWSHIEVQQDYAGHPRLISAFSSF